FVLNLVVAVFVFASDTTYNKATLPNIKDLNADFYGIAIGVAVYYLLAWLVVGRRRRTKSVVVRYQPPDNLSPAAVRYIYTMHSDGRSYVAIVAQLAARKLLAVVPGKDRNTTYVEKLAKGYSALRSLPEEEKRVFNHLLEFDDRVPLDR